MKIKINYYLVKILKDNLIYFLSLVIIVFIYFFYSYSVVNKIATVEKKIATETKEINILKKKINLINYKNQIIQEGIDLTETNQLLSKLIPNREDHFSVIAALERISLETKFLITGYTINLKETKKDSLALTIEGKGDQESFFKFLKDYRYLGQRLITIDKIEYQSSGFSQVKLNVNFYSGKANEASKAENVFLSDQEKKLIQTIKQKVKLELKSSKEESKTYPTKSNPF